MGIVGNDACEGISPLCHASRAIDLAAAVALPGSGLLVDE
nr:hypothetical protein JVH1_4016 [Rhodococcus sp. JVH1]